MSSRKRASGANDIYSAHLLGTPFANNPANNRLAVITRMYTRILTELAANRFKWYEMPKEIDLRFLEMTEFYQALCVFYYNKDFDKYMAMRGGSAGSLNQYDQPTSFLVVGSNFSGKTLLANECVPIWANYVRIPDLDIVTIYANKLAEIDRTIEINVKSSRRTKIVAVNENQRLTATNINRQIDEGQAVVSVSAPLQDMEFITALDLGVNPDTIEKLHIVRTRLWNECMGLLGIENANQDKKERLVSAEVDANADQTSMMRYVNLNARRQAASEINEKYGLNVSVEYNTDADRQAAMLAPGSHEME